MLFVIGAFFGPVLIVGVIRAYVERGKVVESIILSHLINQTQLFWTYFISGLVGAIVLGVIAISMYSLARLIGLFFAVALIAYMVVSSIRGLNKLDAGEASI